MQRLLDGDVAVAIRYRMTITRFCQTMVRQPLQLCDMLKSMFFSFRWPSAWMYSQLKIYAEIDVEQSAHNRGFNIKTLSL